MHLFVGSPCLVSQHRIGGGGDDASQGRIKIRVKYREIIADNFSKAGFSWGCSSEVDSTGRVLFTADAYSSDGRRFTILSDEKLRAFLELERVTGVAFGDRANYEAFELYLCYRNSAVKRYWEIIADNLSKAGSSGAVAKRLDRDQKEA